MTVLEEVRAAIKGKDSGPLGAIAEALASRLDDPDEASPAPVAKELRATLAAISDLKPAVEDPVDQIQQQRATRIAKARRGSAAPGS